jgi:hypothetical protein
MQIIKATDLDRKSGGAQWRDLQFSHSNRHALLSHGTILS